MATGNFPNSLPFRLYCQKILPAVYDDSLSYYEAICKMADVVKRIIDEIDTDDTTLDDLVVEYKKIKEQLEQMDKLLEEIKNGDYVDLYLDSIIKYIDDNLQCLVARIVKFVCFGLNDDGYFVAYIPKTWEFLEFDTGMVFGEPNYGYLILKW